MADRATDGTAARRKAAGTQRVVSVRLDPELHRRLEAYASSRGLPVSSALRELVREGLAADGLDLYSDMVANSMRVVLAGTVAELDALLRHRNDELEDRVARIVARFAKHASVASLAAVDILQGLFPALQKREPAFIWGRYAKRAGEMQAGKSFAEALRDANKS